MHVVVTGGAGFIGSHLCDALLSRGYQITCLDNLLSGRESNISHLTGNAGFKFIMHDVTQSLPEMGKVDAIFHFASPASPNPESPVSYMSLPLETLMVNSIGTKNMLDLARASSCPIVLASSSEVYGDPAVHPQVEEYWGNVSPNGPRSCYDEGKRFLEAISFTYHRLYQTPIKVIRIFNTYGPRMRLDEGRFIPSLFASHFEKRPFSKFGSGTNTRSFCFVSDLIDGILKIFDSQISLGSVLNLGSDVEYAVNDVISLFERITGEKLNTIQKPELAHDPKKRKPDLTKVKKLGYAPKISLEEGLKKLYDHYRQNESQ